MNSLKSHPNLYRVILWTLLFMSGFIFLRLAPILIKPEYIPVDDFSWFWASGKLISQGQNPYLPQKIAEIMTQVGGNLLSINTISIMLTPPWTAVITLPFGLLSYPFSRVIWLFLNIIILLFCAEKLWQKYNGPKEKKWIAWLVVFTFAPTISVLEKGQLSVFILLGIVLFLVSIGDKSNYWLAGVSFWFMAFKPQLIYLFWIALLFWVITRRNWTIAIAFCLTLTIATTLPLLLNPMYPVQYLSSISSYPISEWATPSLGSYLRFWIDINKFELQFIPAICGIFWFIIFWSKRSKDWNWTREFPVLIAVSILTSPYAWTYDAVIFLPAIIQSFVWILLSFQERRSTSIMLIAGFMVINILNLILHIRLSEFYFVWYIPGLTLWYFITRIVLLPPKFPWKSGDLKSRQSKDNFVEGIKT